MPIRHFLERPDARLSWLDFGGPGPVLACLHGHFGCARNFTPLAQALRGHHRVVALDQRGHGWSTHPEDCSREAYLADVGALLDELSPQAPVHLLGHSLGGANAYQFAGRHPGRAASVIVEDMGCHVEDLPPLGIDWPHRVDSVDALQRVLAPRHLDQDRYFLDSVNEFEDGWGLRFDPAWIARSQEALAGDWQDDWKAVRCPILLVRGAKSWATTAEDFERMRAWQPGARHLELPGAHVLHDECREAFNAAVKDFLADVTGA